MTVRSDISAGLEEVEEALDQGALLPLNGNDHAATGAFSGGFEALGEGGITKCEDVSGGIWEGSSHED